jgi:Kdo2-lipid IVA lauroyltransferase/acyltransferase
MRVARPRSAFGDALGFLPVLALRSLLALLPWRARVAVAGALGRRIVASVPKLRRRVETNLDLVMPELDAADRARIVRETGDTFGRTMTEMMFARAFRARRPWRPPVGPAAEALAERIRSGQGVIVLSGHIGQWEAGRDWMRVAGGRDCAGVYRKVKNRYIEALYFDNISFTGAPMFPKGRTSVRGIAGHIARGGVMAFLVDQHERRGEPIDFLGRPAPTTLIAAEFALRYDVPLFVVYGIRAADGVAIDVLVEPAIPHTTAREMMEAFNASLARQVRAHPGQYYWLHRRWVKAPEDAFRE